MAMSGWSRENVNEYDAEMKTPGIRLRFWIHSKDRELRGGKACGYLKRK
jgi:hypothetical protein